VFKLVFVDDPCPNDVLGQIFFKERIIKIYRKNSACHGFNLALTVFHELVHLLIFVFGNWSDDSHNAYDCLWADLINLIRRKRTPFFYFYFRDVNIPRLVKNSYGCFDGDVPVW